MQPNEASISISEDDFAAAQRLHFRSGLSIRGIGSALVWAGLLSSLLLLRISDTIDLSSFVRAMFGCVALGAGLLFLVWLTIPMGARRTWSQRKIGRDIKLHWDENGLRLATDRGDGNFGWNDFYRWSADAKMLLIYIDRRLFYLLPIRALPPGATEAIIGYLKTAGVPKR